MLKVARSIKLLANGVAVMALTNLSAAAADTSKFFVECHSFGAAGGNNPQEYAYHLRAFGYSEAVENGIDINLDEKNVFLSVDTRQFKEEYKPIYRQLPLVLNSKQPCEDGKCKQVEYEPKDFEGKLVVTYDKDDGVIFIKHAALETTVQTRGGCLFVPLPTNIMSD